MSTDDRTVIRVPATAHSPVTYSVHNIVSASGHPHSSHPNIARFGGTTRRALAIQPRNDRVVHHTTWCIHSGALVNLIASRSQGESVPTYTPRTNLISLILAEGNYVYT